MAISVPEGHVALIILQGRASSFYLQIPLNIIDSLCLKPRKYLLFLGWCILGVEGVLAHHGNEIPLDGNLINQGIYHYVAASPDLVHAVDLEVIKARTHMPSQTTEIRDEFCTNLQEREGYCAWTQIKYGTGLHIIPHHLGSEWFRLIIANRPKYDEDVTTLNDINDIRNGVFASATIHQVFDSRHIAILKTPNHILGTEDIPRHKRADMREDMSYPPRKRYTLQWLVNTDATTEAIIPNNADAAFKKGTRKQKPSDLLLHYNYAATAVKYWGRGMDVLRNRANPPRPSVSVAAPAGPSKTKHDRGAAIRKLAAARAVGGGSSTAETGAGGLVESEDQAEWDENDAILFFWGNTPAAKERHLKQVDENTRRMEQWRKDVPQVSD